MVYADSIENYMETHMPKRPDHPCSHPGCTAHVSSSTKYCEIHREQHLEEVRSASSQGYGKIWKKYASLTVSFHELTLHGLYYKKHGLSTGNVAVFLQCC